MHKERGAEEGKERDTKCATVLASLRIAESLQWNLDATVEDGNDEYEIAHPRPTAGAGRRERGV